MDFDIKPELGIQRQILANKLEALKQQHYDIGLEVIIAEAQVTPATKKDAEKGIDILKARQKNAAKAAERLNGELEFLDAQIKMQTEIQNATPPAPGEGENVSTDPEAG